MSEHHRIVVGIGPHGKHEAALEYAALEANRRGSSVHLLVVAHPFLDEQRAMADLEIVDGELRREHTGLLLECESSVREWLTDPDAVTTELTHGRVAPALCAVSEHADLVVLQHHHMGRAFHLPTLSVTNAVASRAATPVVAVPDGWHEAQSERTTVVACVQDGRSGAPVVEAGFAAARRLGGDLRILQAWSWTDAQDEEDEELFTVGTVRRFELLTERLTERLRPVLEANEDVPHVVDVQHGQAGYVLTGAGDHARLLVVGRHHPRHRVGSHLGPVTRSVLTYARVPVLVVDTRD